MAMWMGALELDLLLGDVHSLKEKRSLIRPLIAEVRKRFELSVARLIILTCIGGRLSALRRSVPIERIWSRCWMRLSS